MDKMRSKFVLFFLKMTSADLIAPENSCWLAVKLLFIVMYHSSCRVHGLIACVGQNLTSGSMTKKRNFCKMLLILLTNLFLPVATADLPGVTQPSCGGPIVLSSDDFSSHIRTLTLHSTAINCEWNITAPSGPLVVKCTSIDIPESPKCEDVFVGLYAHGHWKKYCGKSSFSQRIDGSTVGLEFKSLGNWDLKGSKFSCQISYNPQPTSEGEIMRKNDALCMCGKRGTKRIVGGDESGEHEFPWQAMLLNKSFENQFPFCGGSLIHKKWILTAAHCTIKINSEDLAVRLGEHNGRMKDGIELDFSVTRIIKHENYTSITMDNDIALLELAAFVSESRQMMPVCLPSTIYDLSGKSGTVSGWGVIKDGSKNKSDVLRKVDLSLQTTEECRKNYMGQYITDNMICTYADGKDSCQGDSGGPLVWEDEFGNNIQLGIVSWGFGCALENNPGIYTKVWNYKDWIKNMTGVEDELCNVEAS